MANTYTLISSVTVGSGGASSIDFTSIPATYTDLLVKLSLRSSYNAVRYTANLNLNSSSSNFAVKTLIAEDGTPYSQSFTTALGLTIPALTATSSTFGSAEIYIPNYAGSTYKSISSDSSFEQNSSTTYGEELAATLWSNTAAITQVSLVPASGNFAQYSTAYLYGIKNS